MDAREPPPASPARAEADEAALLAGVRAGDEAAFEALVRACSVSLLATARRFLRHEEDARDAVQEAFLAAFKAIPGFDGRARLSTWLHRITINAALQKLRSRRRQHEQPIEPLLPQFLPDGHQAHPAAEWPEPADARVQRGELCALVHACIDRLPDAYRSVLLLRDIEGLDTEETARLLGVNAGAVKTRLHRARQALRALLDPHLRGDAP
jgi:RNA polymerase sigma-70 factor (ECF subfamily)